MVEMWITCSGQEWTVKRLKSLKAYTIAVASGTHVDPPEWYAKGPTGLKGVPGLMVTFACSGVRNFGRALSLLNIYTALVAEEVTSTQLAKFLGSVESGPEPPSVNGQIPSFLHGCEVLGLKDMFKDKNLGPVSLERLPKGKRTPLPDGKFYPIEYAINTLSAVDADFELVEMALETFQGPFMPSVTYGEADLGIMYEKLYAGNLLLKQEPGFKLRGVAAPSLVWQAALWNLYSNLKGVISSLPQDCTFDQEKGVQRTMKALQEGRRVHSLDLSNATDLFPLSVQLAMLLYMGVGADQTSLIEKIFRLPWITELPNHREVIWSRGQPLGTYPSFYLFALAHHAVLAACGASSDDYSLLGDDVVIYDTDIADRYTEFMTSLGCKFGAEKCLTSNLLAEFAGRVIHKDGYFTQYKWREPTDENFLDVARALGYSASKSLPKRYAKVVEILSEVPEELGGLGWNPKGIPYSVLWSKWVSLLDKTPTDRLTRVDKQYKVLFGDLTDRSDLSVAYIRASLKASVAELERRASAILPTGWMTLLEAFSRNLGLYDPDWPFAYREPYRTNQFRNWQLRLGL
jgi:hypothetical protein